MDNNNSLHDKVLPDKINMNSINLEMFLDLKQFQPQKMELDLYDNLLKLTFYKYSPDILGYFREERLIRQYTFPVSIKGDEIFCNINEGILKINAIWKEPLNLNCYLY